MYTVKRTDSSDPDFLRLMALLDADLVVRDGSEHGFYAQFNKPGSIKHTIVIYENDTPAGIGAIKEYTADATEVKRMYVAEDKRGRGIASRILTELENWAAELGYQKCVLETGKKQPEAIALYLKCGYV